MTSFRLVSPYIRWGTNLANAFYFPLPLDNVASYSEPREGSQFVQGESGIEDSWIPGFDYCLEGDARWLQASDTIYYPRCTGWDGTLGIRAWLEDARTKNTFSWHPDGRNLLRLPNLNSAGAIANAGRGGWATGQSGAPTGVTNAFSGPETAWQTTGTGAGGTCSIFISQQVPCIPGETVIISADYKASGLTGGANGFIQIDALDASRAFLSTICQTTGLTATGYTRAATATGLTPANAAYLSCLVGITLPIGNAGTVFFRNAMVRRDSTDTTFVGNGSFDGCYLADPMGGAPQWETDGTRRIRLKLRQPTTEFNLY